MGCQVAWLTGLSGAGKSTIAQLAAKILEADDRKVLALDGDAVWSTVSRDLGFTREDICENNRRFIDVCHKSMASHDFVLVPKISPFRQLRAETLRKFGAAFVEVYVQASLEEGTPRGCTGRHKRVG
jgi:bifunctional enzyme CysN/CysC